MNPYLLTLTFLMLMSILTSSEVVRFSQNNLGNQLHGHFQESLATTEDVRAHAALDDFRAHSSENKEEEEAKEEKKPRKPSNSVHRSAPLGFNMARPPNNSRLNFYLIIHEEPHKDYPLSIYETAARLMRNLYGDAAFFKPNVEYRLLDALIALKEETDGFTYPDELSTLTLGDPELQAAFYSMLKGAEGCPSLLNFITFDEEGTRDMKKVNLMFAAPCVVEALINDPQMSERLLALRDAFWEEILEQEAHRLERRKEECKNRSLLKQELREGFERILLDAGLDYNSYKWVFDLSLGKLGNILFVEDPQTAFVRREKYVPIKR